MALLPAEKRIIARGLGLRPDELEEKRLRFAVHAVDHKTTDFYDAMTEADQLVGNVPRLAAIAIVYDGGVD